MSSLYIDRKGTSIKLSGETLVCYENEERVGTIPLAPIERIYLKGDVTLQSSLLAKLGEKGIGIICLSGRKNTPTLFMSQPHNDAERRLAQYELSQNEAFCLAFAKKLVTLKLVTQKNWLWQAANTRLDKKCLLVPKAEELDQLIGKIHSQTTLSSLRGIEGRAASAYFTALSQYLPPSLKFDGRNRRPPRDPFNAVLSLTYTLLHSEAVLAIYGAGLDPYIGFYHSLDYGRESFACDLIEPIRPLVDNWLLGLFRNETLRIEYFSTTQEGCLLGKTGRVHFYQEYEKQVANWRKMLTENCYDLIKVFKMQTAAISPQRRSILPNEIIQPPETDWLQWLENFYFNQRTMMSEIIFHF
ncbi:MULTISPECIES: CRISPR-associated endonuclease Cas1 [Mannheimia]|uniref:CRISPR-associated endonuclease Cas1 n=1 Tax=Mannheimia pernigra TaxID=111844 RepID=A0A7D5DVT1_9PAST|nr:MULTISPECIES: CRISPR-associated endonuclease Cas1 [Mannheimia]QLB39766.1 CRISPR-associated endonuclease Cas1 [Mannheimia pernigra]QLB41740.1 CRISPR-associated endonuclease Cas1 [Mannheimia pernigra]QTM01027.1 CRISPR-associated endonuclease Cas1 [Mannheimia sp. ZY171111]